MGYLSRREFAHKRLAPFAITLYGGVVIIAPWHWRPGNGGNLTAREE
jgi:hypothetical protein